MVRLTDHPDMTSDVYHGRKTTTQQQQIYIIQVCFLLAHLNQRLRVSYCHQPMSVVCRLSSVVRRVSSTIAYNDISSETARPRTLIFGMQHCLVDFYQVCSNDGPGVPNGPAARGLGSKNEIHLKIFFSRTAWLRCLKCDM